MLLNNFRRVLVNILTTSFRVSSINLSAMSNEIKTTVGKLTTYGNANNSPILPPATSLDYLPRFLYTGTATEVTGTNYSEMYFACGDGDTPPTIEDYKLSGELIDELSFQTNNTSANNNSIVFSITATNNTENPITIKEIGICLGYNYRTGSAFCAILLTRDVLPTPVTLNTGDSKTFSITIDFRSLTDTTVNE